MAALILELCLPVFNRHTVTMFTTDFGDREACSRPRSVLRYSGLVEEVSAAAPK